MTPQRVISEVCITFGVTEADLIGPGKSRDISIPRIIAYLVMSDALGLSGGEIGSSLNRTRSTVSKSLPTARWYAKHPEYSEAVETITREATRCPWVDLVPFKSSRNTAAQALQ